MEQSKVFQIIVKNGFYIGDITHVLPNRVLEEWALHDFKRGVYVDPITQAHFAMVDTADGNGSFYGSDDTDYVVEGSNIGICDLDLVSRPQEGLGRIVEDFGGAVTIEYFNGKIIIDWADENIVIDTTPFNDAADLLSD